MREFRTLFSGGELFGVGAEQADWRHADGYELRPDIAAVAQRNGFDVRVANVCDVPYETLRPVAHLHASPSCKNASQANQKGLDDDGEPLPRETPDDLAAADAVCRAIRAHQGETFSLENVWPYRTFESFDRIRAALRESGYSYEYWHLNMADYGVPQTRTRLILIARQGLCYVERPHPTHRKGGDMFHAPWRGWYAAIADLVDALPPMTPAKWQLARMPAELRETTLIGAGGYDGTVVQRAADDPAFTLAHGGDPGSTGNSAQIRAYLVAANSNAQKVDPREGDEPAHTVTGNAAGRTRALLIGGYKSGGGLLVRTDEQPAMTMVAGSESRQVTRAHVAGRWVRMTIQALGRFQTVPDSYQGLTSEINGNGVPCEFARQLMLHIREHLT